MLSNAVSRTKTRLRTSNRSAMRPRCSMLRLEEQLTKQASKGHPQNRHQKHAVVATECLMIEPYVRPRTKAARSALLRGILRAYAVSSRVRLEHWTRTGKARMFEQIALQTQARTALKGAKLQISSYHIGPISSQTINHSATTVVSIALHGANTKLGQRTRQSNSPMKSLTSIKGI